MKEKHCTTWDIFALIKDRGAHKVKSSFGDNFQVFWQQEKVSSIFYCAS